MTKSKRHRDNYTSDWDAFTLEQDSPPEVSNNEWDQIFSERVFRPETKPDVKVKIFNAIHGFIRLNTGYNNPGEYRERLKHLRKQVLLASDLAYNMEKYNCQRAIMISPALDADSNLNHALLTKDLLERFYTAGYKLKQPLTDAIYALDQSTGIDTKDVYWLVRVLDQIVRNYSDGGPLTQSTKNKEGIGNDRQFVTKVLEIAQREAGRKFGKGTIENAIDDLSLNPK